MKQKCFIDTTVILRIIFKKDKVLLNKLLKNFYVYTSPNVLEEATFKIISETIREKYGATNFYEIKSMFEKEPLPDTLVKRLKALNLISDLIIILPVDKEDYKLAKDLCKKYKLLSNDALILAIALRNGINKLATFDSDFKKAKDLIEILDENYFQ